MSNVIQHNKMVSTDRHTELLPKVLIGFKLCVSTFWCYIYVLISRSFHKSTSLWGTPPPFRCRVLNVSTEYWCHDWPSTGISIFFYLSVLYKMWLFTEQGLPIFLCNKTVQTATRTIENIFKNQNTEYNTDTYVFFFSSSFLQLGW